MPLRKPREKVQEDVEVALRRLVGDLEVPDVAIALA